MRLSKTKNVNLTTHHASKIGILLIFLTAVLFVAIHLYAQSKGIIEPMKLPNPTTPKAPQGMKIVADVLDAVGGKSEAGSVKMQISSGGQPSAIGKSQDTAYKLFAGYVYATEVPQPPIFKALFMTPEGEPYPFDVTISDGEWVQVFDSVTYIETQVPETATYSVSTSYYGDSGIYKMSSRFSLTLEPQDSAFKFYAINPEPVTPRTPFVTIEQEGANPVLSWQYDSLTNVLTYSIGGDTGFVRVSTFIDKTPPGPREGWVIKKQNGDTTRTTKKCWLWEIDPWFCLPWYMSHAAYQHIEQTKQHQTVIEFTQIPPSWGTVRIGLALHNDAIVVDSFTHTLKNLKGTEEGIERFYDPDYAAEQGYYTLQITGLPQEYVDPIILPVEVDTSRPVYSEYYPPIVSELENFTFSIIAQRPLAECSWANLTHTACSLSIDIHTNTYYHYWGAFVLPTNLTVDRVFAYSDTLGEEELEDTTDYIINPVEGSNLFLVVVRNQFYYDRLKLEYARRGDANGDGVINSADVVYLINYLFVYGPAPQPLDAGDANHDGTINSADVAYLINYLFIGGPPPC